MNKKKGNYRDEYEILDRIGKGGFGEVKKVKLKNSKDDYRALKIIDLKDIKEKIFENIAIENPEESFKKSMKDIQNELQNMTICSNNNEYSVKYFEHFESEDEFAIVMELCDDNLLKKLKNTQKGFSTEKIYKIMTQLNNTFKIMNNNNIVHRDIKLENILTKAINNNENDFIVKLTDYGISKKVTNTTMCKTHAGTNATMAPEILEGEQENYTNECDLWSIGIIIYQLKFKEYPFNGGNETVLLKNIKNKLKNDKVIYKDHNTGDKNLDDLIKKLLIIDPKERITWKQYFAHPFFNRASNQIIIKIIITNKDKNENGFKNIYFLENVNGQIIESKEEFVELNNNNTELYINNEKKEFKKYFKPSGEGEYTIKIVIKNKIKNCNNMFMNCKNIKSIDLSSFDSSEVTNMSSMFSKCIYLEKIIFGNFNTQKVINMKKMFSKCKCLKEINFPKSFTTENVIDMSLMFFGCEQLNKLNLSFDTHNVTNMHGLFQECFLIKKLDLSTFITDKVNDMSHMFFKCCQLEEIIIDPQKFKTKEVTNMNRMFLECYSLKKFNFNNLITEKVEFMTNMLSGCEQFTNIDLSNFNTKNVRDMKYMFDGCKNLKTLNLSSFRDIGNLEKDDMFNNCKNLREVKINGNTLVKNEFNKISFMKI